jgi:hypothetical protein
MKFRIIVRWDERCGITLNKLSPFIHQIEDFFQEKNYGNDVNIIHILMDCMGLGLKDKKRYKKDNNQLGYDITIDYFSIANTPLENKMEIVRKGLIEKSEVIIRSYKFKKFDTDKFLSDLKTIVNHVEQSLPG